MRLLFSSLILAQALTPNAARPRLTPEVAAWIDQARGLPAEFHSDLLLRIARSALVPEAAGKERLIEEAFWSGGHAFLPYLQYADGRRFDSVAAEGVRANGLEALTLQSNAVQAMLPLNAARALRLFQEIEPPHLADPGCASAFTPNLDIYFQTAALLFQRAFTAAQRGKAEDELLLQQIIGSLEAPAQVPDAVELLGALKLKAEQRRELLALLSARLPNVSRSDREYSGAERELVEAIGRIQASDAALLLPALRAYIVRHAGGRRCSDHLPKGTMDESAEAFNRVAAKLDPNAFSLPADFPGRSQAQRGRWYLPTNYIWPVRAVAGHQRRAALAYPRRPGPRWPTRALDPGGAL